jgi:hypothetical protein
LWWLARCGTVRGVLAEGKHGSSSSRRNTALIVGAVVVVFVAGAVLAFVLTGNDGGGGGSAASSSPEVPAFSFKVSKTILVATNATPDKKLKNAGQQATTQVSDAMAQLYTAAFLDPSNWHDASYDSVWSWFEGPTAAAAKSDAKVLTVSPTLAASLESIEPGRSKNQKLRVKVLFDDQNHPAAAAATVKFEAIGEGSQGAASLVSSGTYMLKRVGDSWRVDAYKVQRDDKAQSAATPTTSAAASA